MPWLVSIELNKILKPNGVASARIHEGKWREVTAETARWSWFSAMAAMKSVVV